MLQVRSKKLNVLSLLWPHSKLSAGNCIDQLLNLKSVCSFCSSSECFFPIFWVRFGVVNLSLPLRKRGAMCNTLCKSNSTCFLDWMLHTQNHSHSQNKIIWQFKGNIRLSYHRFHVCSRFCLLYVSLNEKTLLTVPSYLFLHFRPFAFEKSCFCIIVVIPIKARENWHSTLIEDSSDLAFVKTTTNFCQSHSY